MKHTSFSFMLIAIIILAVLFLLFTGNVTAISHLSSNSINYGNMVQVSPDYDARILNVPPLSIVQPNQAIEIAVELQNVGTESWNIDGTVTFINVGGYSSDGNSAQKFNRVIQSGAVVSFTIALTAPMAPGTYNLYYQMAHNRVVFGDIVGITVVVLAGGDNPNLSSLLQQVVNDAQKNVASQITRAYDGLKRRIEEQARTEVQKQIRNLCGTVPVGVIFTSILVVFRVKKRNIL